MLLGCDLDQVKTWTSVIKGSVYYPNLTQVCRRQTKHAKINDVTRMLEWYLAHGN